MGRVDRPAWLVGKGRRRGRGRVRARALALARAMFVDDSREHLRVPMGEKTEEGHMGRAEVMTVMPRPYLRGRLHQVAAAVSVVGLVFLVRAASTPMALAAAWIFGVASVLLYVTSSSYHILAKSPTARRIMQRADHAMIFVMIAGSFTPSALLLMPDPWRWVSMLVVWLGAACGVTLKLVAMERFNKLGAALYIGLGWAGLMAFPALTRRPVALALFATGGILYTVGAILFALHRPRLSPRWFGYHEVWHTFGVAAGALLFVANFGLIRAG